MFDEMDDMEVDSVADMEMEKMASIMADMEVDHVTDMVADMVSAEVDKVADMEVDKMADMMVDRVPLARLLVINISMTNTIYFLFLYIHSCQIFLFQVHFTTITSGLKLLMGKE